MAPAGVVGRPATMALNARSTGLNDFSSTANKPGEDRSSHTNTTMTQGFGTGSKAWSQGNIWGTSALGTGFGSSVRDASRTRENGTYLGPGTDPVEGKTGSSSLVPSSESDLWTRNLSPWGANDANHSSIEQRRGSAVSPARQRGNNPQQGAQPFQDNSQTTTPYFSLSRNNQANSTNTSKPVTKPVGKPLVETNSNTFALPRQFDPSTNGFSTFNRFADMEGQVHRPETHGGVWGEADPMQSPTDDRGSIANSEYFGATSAAQSRSGSLPPSRHGEPSGPLSQPSDTFSRFQQGPVRGHTSSFSSQTNGRSHQERSGSIQSDSVAMFGRLSVDANAEQPIALHKPSVSVNGSQTPFTQAPQDGAYQRGSISEASQGYLRTEEHHLAPNGGTFTPENFPVGQYSDHVNQLRAFHLTNRGTMTPNGSEFRQSPFYSVGGTPPVFDHLYPSRSEHTARAMSNASPALLERKLRGLQQQEQQGFLQSQYQQMLAAHFRNSYNPYQYTLANGLPVNGLTPVIPAVHTVMQVVEPPKGPRELEPGQAIRSALLEEFKANSKTNKRYELKDIYDHIVEFSGDQHGSRFIQQKLETANSDEKDRVFKELQVESLQLMQDVFGNYVIQKFFEHGDQNQKKVLASKMKGQVLSLSLQMYGCRVVQKALEHILTDQQASLIRELENHVLKCVKDQNGNHVIQKAIERVPAEHIQFIINAFTGQVGQLATHPYGCRVIQRMLEYCEEPARHSILQELHACGPTLISDQYGNYVTQHVIEHGSPDDRAKIIDLVKAQLLPFSKHKFASNVVEKCLVFSNDQQRREIMHKVVEKTDRGESGLTVLIRDGYGNYVIQKILDTLNAEDYATFLESLQPEVLRAKRTISGKQIQSVEKKMHRFDRGGGTGRSSISSHTVATEQSRSNSPPAQKIEEQPAMDHTLLDNSGATAGDAVPAVTASVDTCETVKTPAI